MTTSNRIVFGIAKTPAKHKVTVLDNYIFQNDKLIGKIEGKGRQPLNVNIVLGGFGFGVKFEHAGKRERAMRFIFGTFERMTAYDYCAALARDDGSTPLSLCATAMGLESVTEMTRLTFQFKTK